jgi:hypothetical protein
MTEHEGFKLCVACGSQRPIAALIKHIVTTTIEGVPPKNVLQYACVDAEWCINHEHAEAPPPVAVGWHDLEHDFTRVAGCPQCAALPPIQPGIPRGPQLDSDLTGLAARENNSGNPWPQPHAGSPTAYVTHPVGSRNIFDL